MAYEIGYPRPPKASQFAKGSSGNPKGRPKGSKNFSTLLEQELLAVVTVNEDGRRGKVTRMHAMAKRLMAGALQGDQKAMLTLIEVMRKTGQLQPSEQNESLAPDDYMADLGGGKQYHRRKGDILQPEREDAETLKSLAAQLKAQTFAAQYQQNPEAPEGSLFKRKWLTIVAGEVAKGARGQWWVSIDAAASTSETADYTAITTGFSSGVDGRHYILHAERGRWDYEELLEKAIWYFERVPDVTFIVEATSNGLPLISALKKRGIMHRHHFPHTDKLHRASMVLHAFEAGRVVLLKRPNKDHGWIQLLLNEVLSFPFGRYDDQVDSLVAGIYWSEPLAFLAWRDKHPEEDFRHKGLGDF